MTTAEHLDTGQESIIAPVAYRKVATDLETKLREADGNSTMTGDSIDTASAESLPNQSAGARQKLVLEKILDKRTNAGGKVEYLIQWGHGVRTWETPFQLSDYLDYIEAYENQKSIPAPTETNKPRSRRKPSVDGEAMDVDREKGKAGKQATRKRDKSLLADDKDEDPDFVDISEEEEDDSEADDMDESSRLRRRPQPMEMDDEDDTVSDDEEPISTGPHLHVCDKCGRSGDKQKQKKLQDADLEGYLGRLMGCETCALAWHKPCGTLGRSVGINGRRCKFCTSEGPLCMICNKPPDSSDEQDAPYPLFRCFRCRFAAHIDCMVKYFEKEAKTPPKREGKTGSKTWFEKNWKCVDCIMWDDHVDSIITYRDEAPTAPSDTSSPSAPKSDFATIREFYVKFAEWSYRHCEWVSERWLANLKDERLKYLSFMKRVKEENEAAEAEGLPPVWPKDVADALPPGVLTIEKVLDVTYEDENGEPDFDNVDELYIKWLGLPYEKSYWETIPKEDDELYPAMVKAYNDFLLRDEIGAAKPVTAKKLFTEYMEQPEFVVGGELKGYQLEGLNWLLYKWHKKTPSVLADDMGLGKTVQIVSLIATLHHDYHLQPFLIAAPSSTIGHWMSEFARWAPSLVTVRYEGVAKDRKMIRDYLVFAPDEPGRRPSKNVRCHVLVCNYETLVRDANHFKKIKWEIMVCDEGHRLKNDAAKTFSILKRNLKVGHRIVLTGTPLQNNVRELFNLLSFLDPETFSDPKEWEDKYGVDELTDELVTDLHQVLEPYFLRRTKAVADLNLPPKVELLVPVSLTALQKELYKAVLSRNADLVKSIGVTLSGNNDARVSSLQNILMELRKVCNHPYSLPNVEPQDLPEEEAHKRRIEASGKLGLLHKMLPRMKERGHRILLFSQFKLTLDEIEEYLVEEDYTYCRMDGDTKIKDRQPMIDLFNAPESNCFIFLLTTRTGAEGINLTAADTIILYDADWNPHRDIQAMSRAHRIGQDKPLVVYRLFTRGCVEEKILEVGKKKLVLDHLIIEQMGSQKVTTNELASIIKFGAKALFEEKNAEDVDAHVIKYDDATVEKLLNRAEIMAQKERESDKDAAVPKAGAFSFAKLWHSEKLEEGDIEDLGVEPSDSNDDAFWEALLKKTAADATESIEVDEHGRAKRKRKQVNYTEVRSKRIKLYEGLGLPGVDDDDEEEDSAPLVDEQSVDPEFVLEGAEGDDDDEDDGEFDVIEEEVVEQGGVVEVKNKRGRPPKNELPPGAQVWRYAVNPAAGPSRPIANGATTSAAAHTSGQIPARPYNTQLWGSNIHMNHLDPGTREDQPPAPFPGNYTHAPGQHQSHTSAFSANQSFTTSTRVGMRPQPVLMPSRVMALQPSLPSPPANGSPIANTNSTLVQAYSRVHISPRCWLCFDDKDSVHPIDKCKMTKDADYLAKAYRPMLAAVRDSSLATAMREGLVCKMRLIALFLRKLGANTPGDVPALESRNQIQSHTGERTLEIMDERREEIATAESTSGSTTAAQGGPKGRSLQTQSQPSGMTAQSLQPQQARLQAETPQQARTQAVTPQQLLAREAKSTTLSPSTRLKDILKAKGVLEETDQAKKSNPNTPEKQVLKKTANQRLSTKGAPGGDFSGVTTNQNAADIVVLDDTAPPAPTKRDAVMDFVQTAHKTTSIPPTMSHGFPKGFPAGMSGSIDVAPLVSAYSSSVVSGSRLSEVSTIRSSNAFALQPAPRMTVPSLANPSHFGIITRPSSEVPGTISYVSIAKPEASASSRPNTPVPVTPATWPYEVPYLPQRTIGSNMPTSGIGSRAQFSGAQGLGAFPANQAPSYSQAQSYANVSQLAATAFCLLCNGSDHRTESFQCPLLRQDPREYRARLRRLVASGALRDFTLAKVEEMDQRASFYESNTLRSSGVPSNAASSGVNQVMGNRQPQATNNGFFSTRRQSQNQLAFGGSQSQPMSFLNPNNFVNILPSQAPQQTISMAPQRQSWTSDGFTLYTFSPPATHSTPMQQSWTYAYGSGNVQQPQPQPQQQARSFPTGIIDLTDDGDS